MELDELKQMIELRQGDITEAEADVIVNAANTDLILGAGVSGAIGRKGGPELQAECDRIGNVPLGDAVATTAGQLKAKYVIHAASMEIGHFATERNIGRATRNALARAAQLKARTVVFPAIGTGVAAFPADRCARVMLDVVARYLAAKGEIERVSFVLLDPEVLEAFREVYDQLKMPSRGGRPRHSRPRAGDGGSRDSRQRR
jgi:O-acetyl-ADP-ribose deacetylase (regulator of RNase III)